MTAENEITKKSVILFFKNWLILPIAPKCKVSSKLVAKSVLRNYDLMPFKSCFVFYFTFLGESRSNIVQSTLIFSLRLLNELDSRLRENDANEIS